MLRTKLDISRSREHDYYLNIDERLLFFFEILFSMYRNISSNKLMKTYNETIIYLVYLHVTYKNHPTHASQSFIETSL